MNLINAFAVLKSKNELILFLLSTSVSQLFIDNFGNTEQNFMLTTKNH